MSARTSSARDRGVTTDPAASRRVLLLPRSACQAGWATRGPVLVSAVTPAARLIANPREEGQPAFYGFVSDREDLVSATFLGRAAQNGFAIDNFTFPAANAAIPLPPALLAGAPTLAALAATAALRRYSGKESSAGEASSLRA